MRVASLSHSLAPTSSGLIGSHLVSRGVSTHRKKLGTNTCLGTASTAARQLVGQLAAQLGRPVLVHLGHGCPFSSRSARAEVIGRPVGSSSHAHCPLALHSKHTASPADVRAKSKQPNIRLKCFR